MCLDPQGPKPPSYGQFISLHVERTELTINIQVSLWPPAIAKKCKLSFHIGRVNSYTFFVILKAI